MKFVAKTKKNQSGNMIVTAVITLGIMAIITIGAMKGFEKYQDAKVSNEIQELTELRNETVKYGQAIGSPFDATNAAIGTLSGLNFWEKKQVTGTGGSTIVSNQWGGIVTVGVGTINTPGDALDFSYSGLPTYSCKAIGTKVDAIAAKITVNGTTVKNVGQRTDAANLGVACDAASDNATMVYTLSR